MGLEKAIASGKEYRKPYYRSKRFDTSCRCHGGCLWCEGSRTYQDRKLRAAAEHLMEMIFDSPKNTDYVNGRRVTMCPTCGQHEAQDCGNGGYDFFDEFYCYHPDADTLECPCVHTQCQACASKGATK